MLRWNLLRNWNPWAPESAIHAPGKRSGDAMQAKDVTKANEYVHELDSILSAVSIVGILSHQLAQSKDRTRKIYAALVNVTTAAATLMGHLDNIKRSGITELHAAKMCLLSNCLEEVFSDDVLGLVDEHKTWEPAHRRLRAVIASNTQEWYTDAKRYAPRLNSLRELGHILRQLKGFIDEFQHCETEVDDRQADLDSEKMVPREPDEVACRFVQDALDAVLCRCACRSERKARLELGTLKKGTCHRRTGALCVLLSPENPICGWHELHIRNTSTGQGLQVSEANLSSEAACLCHYLRPELLSCHLALDFVLNKQVLEVSQEVPNKRLVEANYQNEVDLEQLITHNSRHWSIASKYALAVILAYSLLYLLRGGNVKGQWTRKNILFFANRDHTHIPLRPFFNAPGCPTACVTQAAEPPMYHKFPAILELGVMLLETVLGERLEPFFEARERVQSTDGLWWYACTVYRENEDYISDITSGGFKSAIHACICPGTFSNYINDDQEMRLKIFQDIVRPLEQDLRAVDELSGDADLAESLTTYDLGVTCNHDKLREGKLLENEKKEAINVRTDDNRHVSIHMVRRASEPRSSNCGTQDRENNSRMLEETTTSRSRRNGAKVVKWADEQRTNRQATTREPALKVSQYSHDRDESLLFGRFTEHQPCNECQTTSDWVQSFKTLMSRHKIGESGNAALKIAVLDTGIDMSHPIIDDEQSRIKDFKTWCGGRADEDADGHGTHIAGILLDLTRNVDLYIGKIIDTESVESRDHIAQALQYARDEWKVDMISLSFGYRVVTDEDRVAQEVRKCLKQDILIFAAASNDGGRRSRTYPAKYDQVFCIHASNGVGGKWGYNPPPLLGAKEDNFSIVGQCLGWPSTTYPMLGIRKEYRSGTSFATPVAVSIAAFMVDFIKQNMAQYQWNTHPCTPEGMRKVFRELKVDCDGYEWVCPERYLADTNHDTVRVRLKEILGGYEV